MGHFGKILRLHSGVVLLSIVLAAVAFVAGFATVVALPKGDASAAHVVLAAIVVYCVLSPAIAGAYFYVYKGGLAESEAKYLLRGWFALMPFVLLYPLFLHWFEVPASGDGVVRYYLLIMFAMLYTNFALVLPAHRRWLRQKPG